MCPEDSPLLQYVKITVRRKRMGLVKKTIFLVWIFAVMGFPFEVQAGDASSMGRRSADGIFTRDRIAVQVVSGVMNSSSTIGPKTAEFDYIQTNLRLGWMLNSPAPSEALLRGNVEAILELTYSAIYSDHGDYFAGLPHGGDFRIGFNDYAHLPISSLSCRAANIG